MLGWQRVQFTTLFQLLSEGRPMVEYKYKEKLFKFLSVPDFPSSHWTNGVGWLMATYMYDIIKEKHKGMLATTNYIALTHDETSRVDNSSYIVVHAYLFQNWELIPLILHLQKLEPGKSLCVFSIHFLFIQVCFY